MGNLLEDEAIEFARELIRIPTVNTGQPDIGDGETRAARFVQDRLAEAGIASELIESRPGRGNLVARIEGSDVDAGALLVHAHLDVVPVAESDWAHPPFAAEIDDDMLYGRGAVDMKNFAGAILAIARHFAREGIVPRRTIVLAWVADEEAGGEWGAGWLVDNRPELFAGVIEAMSEVGGYSVPLTPDGPRAYLAATAEKGVAVGRLVARGRAGHGSRPTDDNAVVRLAQVVAAVGEHRFPASRTPALERFLDAFGRARGLSFSDETLARDIAQLGFLSTLVDASLRTTVVPTVLRAGDKENIIPAAATATFDVRTIPGHDDEAWDYLASLATDGVEFPEPLQMPAIAAPTVAPIIETFQRAISAEDPDGVVVPYLLQASTDNKHFARIGIHGYGFVPLRVPLEFDLFSQFHAADEHVPLDALRFSARVTERILREA
ncbi:MAG: M20/M25/M40 family metallo-hydrolase [Microbacterium sp.]